MVFILVHKGFNSFVGHDHNSIPGHVHNQSDRQRSVEGVGSFIPKHIFENLEVVLVVQYLTSLFHGVERRHDDVMGHAGQGAANGEVKRP